ncbi:MAG: sulfatase [Planctomycetaceae bacterium]|nr:sulfatase [Planctomycetaceae bacterium]
MGQEKSSSKPNFVIIISDDSSFHDFGCWGNTDVKTPNIDRLAEQGMRLTHFYSPAAVCSPTRQALLTGLYPVRNGAYPNHSRVYPKVKSLPYYLDALGYKTICVGKQHFNPIENYPFHKFIGMIGEDKKRSSGETSHLEQLEQLEQFVKDSPEKPFCLYIASHEPHSPWNKGDASIYDAKKLKLPPYFVDTPETRRALKRYYAEVTYLDGQVGKVLQLLEKTGHIDDTFIFFFSEQGSSLPHGKWTLYDVGVRVAAVVRLPGKIKAGSVSPAIIQYIDVLPTIIELAGGDPKTIETGQPDALGNKGFDGKSFKNVLFGTENMLRDYAFAQHTSRGIIQGPEYYASRMVTDGHWKLIYNIDYKSEFKNSAVNNEVYQSWVEKGKKGDAFAKEQAERYVKRPEWELYDLTNDRWEMTNIADAPENTAIKTKLKTALKKWMEQQGDLGHETEIKASERQVK